MKKRFLRRYDGRGFGLAVAADAAHLARSITRLGAYVCMRVYEKGQCHITFEAGCGWGRLIPYLEWLSSPQLEASRTVNRRVAVEVSMHIA
jgi:hypothetical protein